MAISKSLGYPGTIAPGADWATMNLGLGSPYWVADVAAVRVTPKTNGTREVNIAAGNFGGVGIADYNDATVALQLSTVTTGTQYFWIWARRTWQTSNATIFAFSAAGTTMPITVPPAAPRNVTPGTIDDQPLALVSLTAGQTVPVVVADLRWIGIGTGTKTILHDLARSYAGWTGPEFQLGNSRWLRTVNSAGTATAWLETPGPFKSVALPTLTNSQVVTHSVDGAGTNWTGSSAQNMADEAWVDGNVVTIYQLLRRTSGTITPASNGAVSSGDRNIGMLAENLRPPRTMSTSCRYRSGTDSARYSGTVVLFSGGIVSLETLTPGKPLTSRSATSEETPWCIEFDFTYVRKG